MRWLRSKNEKENNTKQTKKAVCGFCIDLDAVTPWINNAASGHSTNPSEVSRGIFCATVGLERILALLRKHNIKATFFIPAHTIESFRVEVEKVKDAGHEIGLHGYAHEHVSDLTEEQERAILTKSMQVVTNLTGKPPQGWTAPAWQTSHHTVELLEEFKLKYDHSFMHHDCQPYYLPYNPKYSETKLIKEGKDWMKPMSELRPSSIIEIPANWHLDDWPPLNNGPGHGFGGGFVDPDVVFKIWTSQFDYYYEEYDSFIFPISIHPQVSGKAHVLRMLEKVINYINSHEGVQWETMESIAGMFELGVLQGHTVSGGSPN